MLNTMNENDDINSVIQGCLYGLAIGDALGSPIKFETLNTIKSKYGEEGLKDFEKANNFPKGCYSSETQLTMATVQGILSAYEYSGRMLREEDILKKAIYLMYREWLKTQGNPLFRRNPNEMVMLAISNSKTIGTLTHSINDSKSSSNISKVIPLGLILNEDEAFRIGMEITAYTHGHPLAILSGGFLASLVACIRKYRQRGFDYCLNVAIGLLKRSPYGAMIIKKIEEGVKLNVDFLSQEHVTFILGEGWEIEDAISFALYCIAKYKKDYKKVILSSINHSGNSDSIGAITGGILGAFIGYNELPQEWVINVENTDKIAFLSKNLLVVHDYVRKYNIKF